MIVVAAMPVFRWPAAVIAPRKKGGDRKNNHAGARADRAQPARGLSARFHDQNRGYEKARNKNATNDWGAPALYRPPESDGREQVIRRRHSAPLIRPSHL